MHQQQQKQFNQVCLYDAWTNFPEWTRGMEKLRNMILNLNNTCARFTVIDAYLCGVAGAYHPQNSFPGRQQTLLCRRRHGSGNAQKVNDCSRSTEWPQLCSSVAISWRTKKKRVRCLIPQPNLARNINARKPRGKKQYQRTKSSGTNGAPFSSKANLHEAVTCNHNAFNRVFPIFLRFESRDISSLVIERSGTPKNVHLFVIH